MQDLLESIEGLKGCISPPSLHHTIPSSATFKAVSQPGHLPLKGPLQPAFDALLS